MTSHGMKGTSTYRSWAAMKTRCTNKNHSSYKWYGAKGIKFCDSWDKFVNFYEDMGDRPEGMTLDRIDGTKDYCKENCRWADWETQENNRASNRRVKAFGEVMTVAQWAKRYGMERHTLLDRLDRGMEPESAISSPVGSLLRGNRAKINPDIVRHIRTFLKRHPAKGKSKQERIHLYAFLAEWYQQPKGLLRKLARGETWKHIVV